MHVYLQLRLTAIVKKNGILLLRNQKPYCFASVAYYYIFSDIPFASNHVKKTISKTRVLKLILCKFFCYRINVFVPYKQKVFFSALERIISSTDKHYI